jgi:hypothetical protein
VVVQYVVNPTTFDSEQHLALRRQRVVPLLGMMGGGGRSAMMTW